MRRLLGMLSLCALTACGANAAAETHTHPPHRTPAVSAGTSPDPGLAVADMAVYITTVHYLEAQQVHAYLDSLAVAAYLAASTPPPPAPPAPVQQQAAPAPSSSGATGACGGATNGADQFIQRESGGNPNALNPSGAWGCYQIMPGTWSGAGCDNLGAYGSANAAAQAACASRLGLSAWNL